MTPRHAQPVVVRLPDQELPARVDACDERHVTLVLSVPPDEALPARPATVEYRTATGIHRISGELASAPGEPAVLRLERAGQEVVQRREWARVDATVPVEVRFEDAAIDLAATVALNVSGGGALVRDTVGLPMGARVVVEFRLDGAPVVAGGRIVRQTHEAKGIELDAIAPGDRDRIARFVLARQRAEQRLRGERG
jgi:hypothetical protein